MFFSSSLHIFIGHFQRMSNVELTSHWRISIFSNKYLLRHIEMLWNDLSKGRQFIYIMVYRMDGGDQIINEVNKRASARLPLPKHQTRYSTMSLTISSLNFWTLQVNNLEITSPENKSTLLVSGLSFEVKSGEILAVLATSQQEATGLLDVLAGVRKVIQSFKLILWCRSRWNRQVRNSFRFWERCSANTEPTS